MENNRKGSRANTGSNIVAWIAAVWLGVVVLGIAFWVTLGAIALHFIHKLW